MINYRFIGWCQEDNHDKVWAAIMLEESDQAKKYGYGRCRWVAVWGRRGKKLQSKVIDDDVHNLRKLVDSKRKKGYKQLYSQSELGNVYPEFQSDLEKTAVWSLLKV